MSKQGMIEVVLDRWVTSNELSYIREHWYSFYHDPMGHSWLVTEICDELDMR